MSAMSTPSPTFAARWTTASTPGSTRSRTSASRTSPTTRSAGWGRPESWWTSGRRLSRTTTSSPASVRADTAAVPMNPAPPVTSTRRTETPAPGTLHGNSRDSRSAVAAPRLHGGRAAHARHVVDPRQLAGLDEVRGEVGQLPVRVLAHDPQQVEGLGRREPKPLDENADGGAGDPVALQRDLEVVGPVGAGRRVDRDGRVVGQHRSSTDRVVVERPRSTPVDGEYAEIAVLQSKPEGQHRADGGQAQHVVRVRRVAGLGAQVGAVHHVARVERVPARAGSGLPGD